MTYIPADPTSTGGISQTWQTGLISQGWQCPKCKNILSPILHFCIFCSGSSALASSTGNTSSCGCGSECPCKQPKPEFLTDEAIKKANETW